MISHPPLCTVVHQSQTKLSFSKWHLDNQRSPSAQIDPLLPPFGLCVTCHWYWRKATRINNKDVSILNILTQILTTLCDIFAHTYRVFQSLASRYPWPELVSEFSKQSPGFVLEVVLDQIYYAIHIACTDEKITGCKKVHQLKNSSFICLHGLEKFIYWGYTQWKTVWSKLSTQSSELCNQLVIAVRRPVVAKKSIA